MATKLIQLADGTLVEAEVTESEARPISGGAADKVVGAMDKIEPVLVSVCRPLVRAWNAIGDDLQIGSVEVELGLSFEGEGNVFVSKAKAGANLTVTLVLSRRKSGEDYVRPQE